MSSPILIVPSVLPADFSNLATECQALEEAGVDRIQWDVMDGRFVPNLTFGPDLIKACRTHVTIPFEAHLMIEDPDASVEQYVAAGCQTIIVHAESTKHLHRSLHKVRELGASPAVALNPSTPVEMVEHVLDDVDMVLIMTVNPGFGGQAYIVTMEPKVRRLRELLDRRGLDVDLEVDGGIGPGTISGAASAGANVLVAGSALFNDPAGLEHAVGDLRQRAEVAYAARP